jgi:soluble lytic murein transglycosylase-like protein
MVRQFVQVTGLMTFIVCLALLVLFFVVRKKFNFKPTLIVGQMLAVLLVTFLISSLSAGFLTVQNYRESQKKEILKVFDRQQLEELVEQKARQYNVPITLAKSVAAVESQWDVNAVSVANCVGLMQLSPRTYIAYAEPGWNIFDPEHNVETAMRYMSDLYSKHPDWKQVLAIYNGGYKYQNSKQAQSYVAQVLKSVEYK